MAGIVVQSNAVYENQTGNTKENITMLVVINPAIIPFKHF